MSYSAGTHVQVKAAAQVVLRIVPLTSTKAVVFTKLSNAALNAIYARVVDVSGTSVTLGAEKTIATDTEYDVGFIDSTHILFYSSRAYASSYTGYALVLTISGTDITIGPQGADIRSLIGLRLAMLSSTTAIALGYNNSPVARVLTISGTTVTAGATKVFGNGNNDYSYRVAALDSSTAVVAYRRASTLVGNAIVLKVSGTDITVGAAVQYTAANHVQDNWVTKIDSTHACILWRDASDSNKGKCCVATVNGLGLTLGAVGEFESGGMTDPTGDVSGAVDADTLRIAYNEADNDGHMKNGQVSGTTVSWQAGETVHSGGTDTVAVAKMDGAGLGLFMYTDTADADVKVFAFIDSEFASTNWTANPADSASLSDSRAALAGKAPSDVVGLSDFFSSSVRNPVAIRLGLGLGEGP